MNKRLIIPFYIKEESRGLKVLMEFSPEFIQKCVNEKGYRFFVYDKLVSWQRCKQKLGVTTPEKFNAGLLSKLGNTCPDSPGTYLLYTLSGKLMIYPFQYRTGIGARLELKAFIAQLPDISADVDDNPFSEDYSVIVRYQKEIERIETAEANKRKEEERKKKKQELHSVAESPTMFSISKSFEEERDSGVRFSVTVKQPDAFMDMKLRLASNQYDPVLPSRQNANPITEGEPKLKKMLELARELYELGFSQDELNSMLGLIRIQPAPIEVSKYGMINLLIGNRHKEVVMTPMSKTLYILFLKHPEGIRIKELSDYRKEVIQIYSRIARFDNPKTIADNVDNLLDPLRNTANENLSRIKAAFLRHLDPSEAEPYFIVGPSGQKKTIRLDRSLVSFTD